MDLPTCQQVPRFFREENHAQSPQTPQRGQPPDYFSSHPSLSSGFSSFCHNLCFDLSLVWPCFFGPEGFFSSVVGRLWVPFSKRILPAHSVLRTKGSLHCISVIQISSRPHLLTSFPVLVSVGSLCESGCTLGSVRERRSWSSWKIVGQYL